VHSIHSVLAYERFRRLTSIAVLLVFAASAYAEGPVTVKVDRSIKVGTSRLSIGVTHTGPKWEDGNPQAVRRAMGLLSGGLKYQNQHLMDSGTEVPEPRPGEYNWDSLDKCNRPPPLHQPARFLQRKARAVQWKTIERQIVS